LSTQFTVRQIEAASYSLDIGNSTLQQGLSLYSSILPLTEVNTLTVAGIQNTATAIIAVPEPSIIALASLGVATLLFRRRSS